MSFLTITHYFHVTLDCHEIILGYELPAHSNSNRSSNPRLREQIIMASDTEILPVELKTAARWPPVPTLAIRFGNMLPARVNDKL